MSEQSLRQRTNPRPKTFVEKSMSVMTDPTGIEPPKAEAKVEKQTKISRKVRKTSIKMMPSALNVAPQPKPSNGGGIVAPVTPNQEYYVVINGALKVAKFLATEPEDPA